MPLIRQLLAFNAYSEGWALYAEQLADELGAYENDPVGRLGYLQSIAFRACRLVVDTGIHAKRWTREQGVQFFVDVNGSNPLEVASEVDRYCSWPGQACGYKVGHSEINRQREQGEGGARTRSSTSRRSTTPSCSAATCRSTCSRRTSTNTSGRARADWNATAGSLADEERQRPCGRKLPARSWTASPDFVRGSLNHDTRSAPSRPSG